MFLVVSDEFPTTPESDCYPSTISSSSSLGQEEPHDLANLSPVVEDNAADDDCLGWTDGGYIPFSTSDQLGIQAPPPHQYSHEPLNVWRIFRHGGLGFFIFKASALSAAFNYKPV